MFSRTLQSVEGNARLAGHDVVAEIVRLRDQPGNGVVSVGGAGVAAAAIKADLVDEYRLFVNPIIVGAGTPFFTPLVRSLALRLIETRTFGDDVVFLRYQRIREA